MPPTAAAATAATATQKLGMATASLYGKPSLPARSTTCTFTTASTALPTPAFSSLPSFSLAPNRNHAWRRLAPGARLASLPIYHNCNYSNRHNKTTVSNNQLNINIANVKRSKFLGLHFRPSPFFSSTSSLSRRSRSSSSNSGSDPSPSSGSGVAAGMGSENKLEGVDWFRNDHLKTDQAQPPLPSPSSSNHHHHNNKLLTLPTVLTLGRVVAVPLLVITFYMDSWWGRTATTSIFIAAAITDWLDGYLARKMRQGSAFGAFLDPVADKLMVAATLILLCSKPLEVGMFGQVPWLMTVPTIAIIGREITMSAVREWAASKSSKLLEAVAVNNLGKWKTATQMIALTILLATRDSSLGGPWILAGSGVVFLYISAGLSVWSLAVYMSKIWKVLLK